MNKVLSTTVLLAAATFASPAVEFTYNMNQEFSGAQAPGGTAPWVQLKLTDNGLPDDTVKITINNIGLLSGENNSATYINFNDALDLSTLSVSFGTKVGTFSNPTMSFDENGFKADGDGFFDILIDFANGGNAASVFAGGESIELLFKDSDGALAPIDFAFLSQDAGGHGPFAGAAHIQNTTGAGTGGSGWIAGPVGVGINPTVIIPTPDAGSTLALLGAGLLTLGLASRLKR